MADWERDEDQHATQLRGGEDPNATTPIPRQQSLPQSGAYWAPASLVGQVLNDRYRITHLLGEGGMGVVYRGVHTRIDKEVAIKVLAPTHSHDQSIVDRFIQEAKTASKIGQENVVDISDFGETADGLVFLAMEFLDGEDLADTLHREGALGWERTRAMALQICAAMQAAHDQGVIHRDMKPANCFRTERRGNPDFITVLDFGIAKNTNLTQSSTANGLTQTGAVLGTAAYMSPEQARAEKLDSRSDIYSVGVILYEMLTGTVPFTASSFMAVMTAHLLDPPRPLREINPAIDPRVEAIVLRCLHKQPKQRYQSMSELATALNNAETLPLAAFQTGGRGTTNVALKVWIGGAVAAAALTLGGVAMAVSGGSDVEVAAGAAAPTGPAFPTVAKPASADPIPAPAVEAAAPDADIDPGSVDDDLVDDEPLPPAQTSVAPAPKKTARASKPARLSAAAQRAGIAKVSRAAKACGKKSGAVPGMGVKVRVRVTVVDGKVTVADPLAPNTTTPLGRCVARATKKLATFKRAQAPVTFTHTFTL